jgi:hypothetical protein
MNRYSPFTAQRRHAIRKAYCVGRFARCVAAIGWNVLSNCEAIEPGTAGPTGGRRSDFAARRRALARTIHEYLLRRPILSPGSAFLARRPRRLQVFLCRPRLREAPPGIGLKRLAMAFMNNPGWQDAEKVRYQPPFPPLHSPVR